MSGFNQNPQGASAFTFPSLNQPGTTTTASGFTFGAQKTTAPAAAPVAAPAFGATPSLGLKPNMGLTGVTASASIPLTVPQSTTSGTLFGTTWTGVLSGVNNTEPANTTSAPPSLAPAAATLAKSSPFTFGNSATSTAAQPPAIPAAVTTAAPTLGAMVAPQPGAIPTPTLNFSFGAAPPTQSTTTAPPPASTLGMSLPNFGTTTAPKPQMTTTSAAAIAPALVTSTPVASTAIKFSVPASTPLTAATPKTMPFTTSMAMFSAPSTSITSTSSSALPAISTAATSTPVVLTSTNNASGATAAALEEDVMTYSKLQENINKWALELEKQEKIFLHQATEMNGWDRVIVENSEKLHMLNGKIEKVRREQRHLDLELDFVLSQQNELDYMLKGLEKEWGSVPPLDPERQHTYKIAESLDYKLKLMSEDLKEVVDHMNAMNYPPNDEFNPVMQIVRILNAHMNVLLMVERKTNLADTKVKEVGKLLELCKRDCDRACHLYFD